MRRVGKHFLGLCYIASHILHSTKIQNLWSACWLRSTCRFSKGLHLGKFRLLIQPVGLAIVGPRDHQVKDVQAGLRSRSSRSAPFICAW
jgi:hypothetical protein